MLSNSSIYKGIIGAREIDLAFASWGYNYRHPALIENILKPMVSVSIIASSV